MPPRWQARHCVSIQRELARDIDRGPGYGGTKGDNGLPLAPADRSKEDNVETSIIGIGINVSDRFRDVVDENASM